MPYDIGHTTVTVGASLGIAIAYDDIADFEVMLQIADAASYRAKRTGGGVVRGLSGDVGLPTTVQKLRAVV